MVLMRCIIEPFNKGPPEGPLPRLSKFEVVKTFQYLKFQVAIKRENKNNKSELKIDP
jgi:hypothetical protein